MLSSAGRLRLCTYADNQFLDTDALTYVRSAPTGERRRAYQRVGYPTECSILAYQVLLYRLHVLLRIKFLKATQTQGHRW